ncbi:MAG: helix-turn-helix domain-containing protein [Anaerolineae bacterium]|nr:helix-turn-helix domain-containing protein [Anaerolineae bacterium]
MNKEDFPSIMTITEVAEYLGLHELTVRRLAREGQLPALKLGRQWRVKKDLLEKWIENRSLDNVGLSEEERAALEAKAAG